MDDILSLLLVAALCLAIGFVFGNLAAGLRREKRLPAETTPTQPPWEAASDRDAAGQPPGEPDPDPSPPLAAPGSPQAGPGRRAFPAAARAQAASQPPHPAGISMSGVLARAISGRAPGQAAGVSAPPQTIAAQIDAILQEILEGSPLQNRAIRLLELPGKGMVVMVGLDQYADVGSVPDPEIREAIRASVARWEKRASG